MRALRSDPALRTAVVIAGTSRLLVAAVAALCALAISEYPHTGLAPFEGEFFDGWPGGGLLDALLSPLAHQDAQRYLDIAANGYTGAGEFREALRSGFFPLYPLVVATVSGGSRDPGVLLIAGTLVSLACFAAALYVLYRLVELELGQRHARTTLVFLAVFPGALFFGAPFTESLFLLLSVGAFYAARLGRFGVAGAVAAAASATRPSGVVLIVPLLVLYLYGPRADRPPDGGRDDGVRSLRPRYRPRADLGWLALAPLGIAFFFGYLALARDDALAYTHAQQLGWSHDAAFPLVTVWHGLKAAAIDLRQLGDTLAGNPVDPAQAHWWLDSVDFATFCFATVCAVGALRRLPAAYGIYAIAALALPLAAPGDRPLSAMLRFVSVLFPLFMWLALACEAPRRRHWVLVAFIPLLVLATEQFATWHFVA